MAGSGRNGRHVDKLAGRLHLLKVMRWMDQRPPASCAVPGAELDDDLEIIDEDDEVDSGTIAAERVHGDVRFDDVHFSYGGDDSDVIDGISVAVPAGTTLAPGEFLVVADNSAALLSATGYATPYEWGGTNGLAVSLGNGSDDVILRDTVQRLLADGQVVLQYAGRDGEPAGGVFPHNPNGSMADIAGICDPSGRIFGLMPHPERACHPLLGSTDGVAMFESLLDNIKHDVVKILTRVRVREDAPMDLPEHAPQPIEFKHQEFKGFGPESPVNAPPPDESPEEQHAQPFVRDGRKIGRNEPCPCGSGKKFKHCHGRVQ